MRWSVHVRSQPGGEAQKTAMYSQQTVPHCTVFMSQCHGRVEKRLSFCVFMSSVVFVIGIKVVQFTSSGNIA